MFTSSKSLRSTRWPRSWYPDGVCRKNVVRRAILLLLARMSNPWRDSSKKKSPPASLPLRASETEHDRQSSIIAGGRSARRSHGGKSVGELENNGCENPKWTRYHGHRHHASRIAADDQSAGRIYCKDGLLSGFVNRPSISSSERSVAVPNSRHDRPITGPSPGPENRAAVPCTGSSSSR